MKISNWPIDKIIPYERNPKKHRVDWIKQSFSIGLSPGLTPEQERQQIVEHLIDQPIVVDAEGVIIKGHGRLEAAKELGLTEFPVYQQTKLTPEQVRLARIADNRSQEGGWDIDLLTDEMADFPDILPDVDLGDFGLDEDWTAEMANEQQEPGDVSDPALDDVPDVPEEPITRTGDLWACGVHRVLCGDSTKREDVERLMNGKKAELLFTSPPYADMREYKGNDLSISTLKQFISVFFPYCAYQVINLGIKRQNNEIVEYWQEYIKEAKQNGYKFLSWNVWNREQKGGSVSNMSAMFSIEHEWIFVFGYSPKEINRHRKNKSPGIHKNVGNRQFDGSIEKKSFAIVQKYGKMGTIQTIDFERNSIHPAQFPIALPSEYIKAMTNENDLVVDPFGGSGTTMIACEQLGRIACLMEIAPEYCDVIAKRYMQTFSRDDVFLLTNGERIPFHEVEQQRRG